MQLRREAGLGFTIVLAVQLVSSALAIGLLSRLGPMIERVLVDNVDTSEAVEVMLGELVERQTGEVSGAFTSALAKAKSNLTEPSEVTVLEAIEAHQRAAFEGDPFARRRLVAALAELGHVNRDAMRRADTEAQKLTLAGGWTAAILATLSLGLGIVAFRRIRERLELPIRSIRDTTGRIRKGNAQARCPPLDGPRDVEQIARDINWILDQHAPNAPSDDVRSVR